MRFLRIPSRLRYFQRGTPAKIDAARLNSERSPLVQFAFSSARRKGTLASPMIPMLHVRYSRAT